MTTASSRRASSSPLGPLLREWRSRRRLSQLDLATEAEISTRHLSFVETGRAKPSREMVLRLAELLQLPLRDRNSLLTAAGFSPLFGERSLADPALTMAREAVQLVLDGHEPYPALAVDRHWNLQMANRSAQRLLAHIDSELLQPPVNVFRLSLDPNGLARNIVNIGEWRMHLMARLKTMVTQSGDPVLRALHDELATYPPLEGEVAGPSSTPDADVVILFKLRLPQGELALFSTVTVFGTPMDVTLSELMLESFYPADEASKALLGQMAEAADS